MAEGKDKEEDKAAAKPVKASPVLPWMRVPISISEGSGIPLQDVQGLDPRLIKALRKGMSFTELFPVQSVVWQQCGGGLSTAHDLCIAAPTGSGKTLAYALPVINGLIGCGIHPSLHFLQALVVLPTRDLAVQVFKVFSVLCSAVGLRAELCAAQDSVSAEGAGLVGRNGQEWGGADVVVATPGRLMAHMKGTKGFTLRHLKFLVVDETDRLLRQSYQEWLPRIQDELAKHHYTHALQPPTSHSHIPGSSASLAPGFLLPYGQHRCVKLVVSATLTRDPSKLQRLALHCPRYIAASGQDHRYHLPRSLQEFKLPCAAARKPLVLLALLHELKGQPTVVFTSSLDTTHKLYLMLQATKDLPEKVVEFSSKVSNKQRTAALEAFRSGEAKVLVASDAMTRGMDVEGVMNVVNYDAPVYAKTYVHRAGRTARAGKSGRVLTLLRSEDMWHFKSMLRKADNTFVKDYKMSPEKIEGYRASMADALVLADELLAAEAQSTSATLQQLEQHQMSRQAGGTAAVPSGDDVDLLPPPGKKTKIEDDRNDK